jgi:hypothetical protein
LTHPFINDNITKGSWTITTAPAITANWDATQNTWTVPLGGGVHWSPLYPVKRSGPP